MPCVMVQGVVAAVVLVRLQVLVPTFSNRLKP
jgi:hypothetical protein